MQGHPPHSIGNLCNDRIETLMDQTLASFHFEKMDQALAQLLTKKL